MNTCPTQKLKTWNSILAILLLVFLLLAPHAEAATGINKQINFQGKVVNANGTNVTNGNYDFVFSIYTVATGGTAIWTETRNAANQVTVTDGIFRVSLGSITALPGSIDFNTDNIYLGINFNSDGEMTPRVQFTAVPYAFNALKVAGLTVTDTTGTFTLAAAKTLTVNNTLTFAGTDATTITFQGTDTYLGRATTDTLTNKTIGSTGLTFSGATTDITTATGEDLTLLANGVGVLKLGDFTVANGVLYVSATDGTVSETAAATGAQCLQTTGAGLAPVWGGCGSGSGISTVRESDGIPSVSSLSTLEFGPASTSSDEFIITDQTGGVARVVIGTQVGKLNEAETVTGGWTFNTAGTTFTTAINANGGLTTSTTDTALAFTVNGAGDYTFAGDSDSNFQINATPTTDATFNSAVITLNPTGTGSTGTLQGLLVSQSDNANTGVYDSLVKIENLKTPETTTNGLFIQQNAASGTLTNALHINNNAGTLATAILVDGAAPGSFILDTASLDISGAGAITGATGITSATGDITATAGNVAITAGLLSLNGVTRITNAGVGTFITGTVLGSQTFTTNNIADSGALTIRSGGTSGLTFDSASGDITVAANDGLTFAATTVGNNGSRNVTINSGTGGTTATLIVKLDTSGTVVITDTTTLNNAVGVALNTTTAGGAVRVAINGVVTATADNAVTAGDYIGLGTTTAGRAKSLGTTYPSTAGLQVIGRALGTQATPGSTFLLMLNGLDNNVSAGGGGGYNLIKDETTSLTARTTLAFLGAGVTCADNAGLTQTECTIAAGGAGPWTDGAGVTYLTDTAEDVAIGSTTVSAGGNTILQVGSETNRGDVAIYGDLMKKGLTDITAISGTIIDVFVYDTTKDSDNGRWRENRTSPLLSWSTETKDDGPGDACNISTDDRCGTSDFPEKAIMVATTTTVYIFDANTSVMWMKFSQNAAGWAIGVDTNNDPSSVFALNGVLYIGANGTAAAGLYAFDFINDTVYNYDAVDRTQGDKNIANRNTAVTYATGANTQFALAAVQVNDVHGAVIYGGSTVLTNSGPLNGVTFIGAATDAGISTINIQGQRTISYSDVTGDDYNAVWITKRGRLYGLNETQAQLERWGASATGGIAIDTSLVTKLNSTPTKVYDETATNRPNISKTTPTIGVNPDALEVIERSSFADEKGDVIYVGTNLGLAEIHDVDVPSTTSIGWSKFTTTTNQTGYMSGNTRAHFGFNEASGDLVDQSFNNNVLEPKVAPTYGVAGVKGTALTFNGTSTYLCSDANNDAICDTDADFNVGLLSFQVELWFKHSTTIVGTDMLVARFHNTTPAVTAGWAIWMNSTGTIQFGIDDDVTMTGGVPTDDQTTVTGEGAKSWADNQWHHLVAVNTDTALLLFIDGTLVGSDTALVATLTLDASQILSIGSDCSVGAACATGANFWDGQIDEFHFAGTGFTTSDSLTQAQVRKRYLDGRAALGKKVITVTDATTVSGTTIGDSGEAWVPNEFVGTFVEITGGTGVGQTRRVTSNTATVLTVSPAFTTTPDTTSDFEINPEVLYGASNTVKSIGVSDPVFLGDTRKIFVGTNDGVDGGGVTVFNGVGNATAVEIYHSGNKNLDDSSTEWTGTDFDDIQSIAVASQVKVIASQAHTWIESPDLSLREIYDRVNNDINSIRGELVVDAIAGTSFEAGSMGGADLAEWYNSLETIETGGLVALDPDLDNGIKRTTSSYQKDMLGVVATAPGLVLGTQTEGSHQVALVGRVPVLVTTENGQMKAGDRITSSNTRGFGMKASKAGRVIGVAMEDMTEEKEMTCPEGVLPNEKCARILTFVNLVDYLGTPVELVMAEQNQKEDPDTSGLDSDSISQAEPLQNANSIITTPSVLDEIPDKQKQILAFLKELKSNQNQGVSSEIFTDRVSATHEVISPQIITDILYAKKIKADSIEGLEILTDKISAHQTASSSAILANVTAQSDSSSEIASISAIPQSNAIVTLGNITIETAEVKLDLKVLGKLETQGGLIVDGPAQFNKDTIFNSLVQFISKVIFKDSVLFEGRPTFNKDTAGFAVIKKDADNVEVVFEKEYAATPIVSANMTFDPVKLAGGQLEDSKILQNRVAGSNYNYFIVNRSNRGFTIILNKDASEDIPFSWTALSVKDAKRFESKSEPTPTPSAVPASASPTPSSSPNATPTVTPVATSSSELK